MKYLFFLLALISTNACLAQVNTTTRDENGIYLTLSHYKEANLYLPFTKNSSRAKFREPIGHTNEIWIKTADSTYRFYFEDIWGFRRDGIDWRIFNNNAYRVEDTLKICIYSMPTFITYTPGSANFFSKDLGSPIHPLDRKNLMEVFHSNQKLVRYLKNIPWYESVMKWDKAKDRFEFISWMN